MHNTFKLVGRICLTAVHEVTVKIPGVVEFFSEIQDSVLRYSLIKISL